MGASVLEVVDVVGVAGASVLVGGEVVSTSTSATVVLGAASSLEQADTSTATPTAIATTFPRRVIAESYSSRITSPVGAAIGGTESAGSGECGRGRVRGWDDAARIRLGLLLFVVSAPSPRHDEEEPGEQCEEAEEGAQNRRG